MKNSDTSSGRKFHKDNIIRGFRIFSEILNDSKTVQTKYLKAYFRIKEKEDLHNGKFLSPLVTDNVKVGFIIAKRNIRKSTFRNRIRRLLKESCRLNKPEFNSKDNLIYIIYSLTQKGYEHFMEFPDTKLNFIQKEMKDLNSAVLLQLNKIL
ncbi:MAG: ribonuclease P protein component [Bacteroidetes bacterium]|nr:ribonuclease P protein component [Bacteroidota bacterium]